MYEMVGSRPRAQESPTGRRRPRMREVAVLFLVVFSPVTITGLRRAPVIIPRPHLVLLRGGDVNPNEKGRFWSLGALFRLNADAKDDALSPDDDDEEERSASLHLQQGGKGRGGALAVRTRKESRHFLDDMPVSTASSRLLYDDDHVQQQQVQASVQQVNREREESDDDEIDEIEQDYSEDEDETDEEILGQVQERSEEAIEMTEDSEAVETPETEEAADTTIAFAESVELESDDAESDTQEEYTLREEIVVQERVEQVERVSQDAAAGEDSTSKKGLFQEASRLWWTNVWEEPTSEEVPKLEEVVSDDSDIDVSVSDAVDIETVEEKELSQEYDVLMGEEEDDFMSEVRGIIVEEPIKVDESSAIQQGAPNKLAEVSATASTTEEPDSALQATIEAESTQVLVEVKARTDETDSYISSGYWVPIDQILSLGLASFSPSLKVSRHLRSVRKATARVTGLHGFVSRKGRGLPPRPENAIMPFAETEAINEEDLGMIRRRIAAIQIAKQNVEKRAAKDADAVAMNRRGIWRRFRRNNGKGVDASPPPTIDEAEISSVYVTLERQSLEEQIEDQRRKERVKEIDRLIQSGQQELLKLQCEKDDLQRRPNPFFNYTTTTDTTEDGKIVKRTSRQFAFPPQELVDEYLDELFANGRLEKMNHTHLWKSGAGFDDDEDESIGDDLLTPSADARKLYDTRVSDRQQRSAEPRTGNGNGGGGSWLLRQNLGKGGSLGEKIGEATETAAYKAVCNSVMAVLARTISAIHGVNIMTHSDIRLYMEQSPDLPPVGKSVIPGSDSAHDYAQEAIMDAMRKGVHKHKKRGSRLKRQRVEEAFLQRDAVVETLISHCQISAPLLKLFPLAWQRALLGNIITLIAAVVSDFFDGIQLQILGHQMSFAFKPITESDMIRHIGMAGNGFNHRRARPEEFEAAVRATAEDVSNSLQFLDRWHHRALGSGMLRAQIANLIARIVLTLTDEVLSGARMDLWSAQAGGPRMLAGLEYRTRPENTDPVK